MGWHKADVNPHLVKYSDLLLPSDDGGRVFVPLCGKSVDLAYLSAHSRVSHVVGLDIVRDAAEEFAAEQGMPLREFEAETPGGDATCAEANLPAMKGFLGEGLTFLVGDLFEIPSLSDAARARYMAGEASDTSHAPADYRFDAVYDRASIVAIAPSLRPEYVALMGELLRPGGSVLLVTLDRRRARTDAARGDGPPFSVSEAEVRRLYESQPWVASVTLLEEANALTNDEEAARWEKKGVLELYELVFLVRKRM